MGQSRHHLPAAAAERVSVPLGRGEPASRHLAFRRNRALARERIERAYAQFPILQERRRQSAGTLSGGQQRQLEIARALMTDPTVMLIDEPTASIEPRIAAQIYALIAGLARDGKAILLVDQNIKGALGIADYVYVMRTGTLFAEGPRDDVHR